MDFLLTVLKISGGLFLLVGVYFFVVTRLAVAIKSWQQSPGSNAKGLYWLYTNKFLIKLTDNRFIVSAVLLFQYNRLVGEMLKKMDFLSEGSRVLQLSCAYGNFSTRLAEKCKSCRVSEFVVCDILQNQLQNVRKKLAGYPGPLSLVEGDAAKLDFADNSFDVVLIFFLLHELPFEDKQRALSEAMRVVRPGGKVILAEFHKPQSRLLKLTGWAYFSLFEPFALEMWSNFNPESFVRQTGNGAWTLENQRHFKDNFQILTAAKAKA